MEMTESGDCHLETDFSVPPPLPPEPHCSECGHDIITVTTPHISHVCGHCGLVQEKPLYQAIEPYQWFFRFPDDEKREITAKGQFAWVAAELDWNGQAHELFNRLLAVTAPLYPFRAKVQNWTYALIRTMYYYFGVPFLRHEIVDLIGQFGSFDPRHANKYCRKFVGALKIKRPR